MTVNERHLMWMAGVSWDGICGTDRHLATAMARHAPIIWVDPPVSPVRPTMSHDKRQRLLMPVLSIVDDRITRLTTVALPGLSRPGVRATTAVLVRSQVRWALRRLRIQPYAVVATHLQSLLGYWGRDVVDVLYGTDDYVAGAKLMGLSARHLRTQELRALARADVAAVVSPQLAQRWNDLGAEPVIIPNGCWPNKVGRGPVPSDMPGLLPPVVGLIGQLSERIDLDVLHAIANAGFSLLIVGPLDPRWGDQRFMELIHKPMVHYAGPVPTDAVRSYLAAIDVGITPYRDTPFNRASFPLKTLEYLGAGLPVVSADLPTARWLRQDLARKEPGFPVDQVLALANDQEEFVEALRRMVGDERYLGRSDHGPEHDRDQMRADLCVMLASQHSWPRRAEVLASAIGLASLNIRGNERTGIESAD